MQNELKNRMGKDLNISKFTKESNNEYNQRLIYSAASAWVRTLIFGNSLKNLQEKSGEGFPDILYVQNHLAKVLEAYMQGFSLNQDWLDTGKNTKTTIASDMASVIIQEMIYTQSIGEVNERQLCHVPRKQLQYGDWIQVRGINGLERKLKSFGVTQWTQKGLDIPVEEETKIISLNGAEYYEVMKTKFSWNKIDLREDYEMFEVGKSSGYSKCWKPYGDRKLVEGIYLLREQSKFNGGYLLIKQTKEERMIASLEPWYQESNEIYRIMYTLNYHNNTPAHFRVLDYDDFKVMYFPSRLPDYENRLIRALSWPYRHYADNYARVVSKEVWKLVEQIIVQIGAELVYQ